MPTVYETKWHFMSLRRHMDKMVQMLGKFIYIKDFGHLLIYPQYLEGCYA